MMLDVRTRRIVIIGGGNVASRKALGLVEAEATNVQAVAPQFTAEFPKSVALITAQYEKSHIESAALVFAATNDPQVNSTVVRDAHELGLLVCRADTDEEQAGDFITPAKLREGAITVTVAAGSPALAVVIRNGLAQHLDKRWRLMADAMLTLRPMIVAAPQTDPDARAGIFRDLATQDALDVLARDGPDGLKRWLIERHPELA
jgi:precorrin-2 dehydrogenase / sirohydrochlorin ferrochelatase